MAEVGLHAGLDGELVNLVGLAGELLSFPGEVGFEVAVEFGAEGAARVGDVVDGSVLLDGAGGALPSGPVFRVVGYGPEAAGEITRLVMEDGVAAGVDVATDRQT